jgi:hypothetical protein
MKVYLFWVVVGGGVFGIGIGVGIGVVVVMVVVVDGVFEVGVGLVGNFCGLVVRVMMGAGTTTVGAFYFYLPSSS